jgi:hypothetical protein
MTASASHDTFLRVTAERIDRGEFTPKESWDGAAATDCKTVHPSSRSAMTKSTGADRVNLPEF